MPDDDDPMEIHLGGDPPPSMKAFENFEKSIARAKALKKYVRRLERLPNKYQNFFPNEEVRRGYLLRDFIDLAIEAIKEEVYFEGNFQEVLMDTIKIIITSNCSSGDQQP